VFSAVLVGVAYLGWLAGGGATAGGGSIPPGR